ncbi:MAG TPA: DUF1043 family protein [Hyphomicrobiales bacterium]|nr:DUF1043 family protein [Hyphomicrobiales bacterium]
MSWILAIACFLVGAAVGALLFKLLRSDEAQVRELKQQLQRLSEEHEAYKSNVHTHFSNSARLLNALTDSYREVYTHMAEGARSLCPDYISSQLTLTGAGKGLLDRESGHHDDGGHAPGSTALPSREPPKAPPLDYATKTDPQAAGPLSESYGVEKP